MEELSYISIGQTRFLGDLSEALPARFFGLQKLSHEGCLLGHHSHGRVGRNSDSQQNRPLGFLSMKKKRS